MYGEQVQISDAFFISFFSITVVFIVLLLISYMTDIVAFFVNKKQKVSKNSDNIKIESKSSDSGVDTKVVAAITAAICMIDGKSPNNIIIKSIKRVPKWK